MIRRVINKNLGKIRKCYYTKGAAGKSLTGKVKVRFVIGPSGYVSSANARADTLNHLPTQICILMAVKGMRFPKVPGGSIAIVNCPFIFKLVAAKKPQFQVRPRVRNLHTGGGG